MAIPSREARPFSLQADIRPATRPGPGAGLPLKIAVNLNQVALRAVDIDAAAAFCQSMGFTLIVHSRAAGLAT